MSSRFIRDTTVLAKIEAVYGTDSVPTGAANAMAVSNVRITPLNAQYVSRDLLREFFGAEEELIASYNKLISFDVEAVGSGTAGTAPAWSPLIRACGFGETLTALERATYKPITNGQESVSMYAYDSGVLHKYLGAKGAVNIGMGLNNIPKLQYAFVAIDGGDTAATPAGVSWAGFKVPQVIKTQDTGTLTFGCALVAPGAEPELTGGTGYPSRGIEIDSGIKAEFIDLLGSQSVEITDRGFKGKVSVDASAAQEIAFLQAVRDGTLQSIGLQHGTVVGRRVLVFAPKAQLKMPGKGEIQGKRLVDLEAVFTPDAGNDELTIVTSF